MGISTVRESLTLECYRSRVPDVRRGTDRRAGSLTGAVWNGTCSGLLSRVRGAGPPTDRVG